MKSKLNTLGVRNMMDIEQQLQLLRTEIERLKDLEDVRCCIYNAARALDRLDRGMLESLFWPDAKIDYGKIYHGNAAGFVDIALQFQGAMRDTQHLVGNVQIVLEGARAKAESYVHAHHVIQEGNGLIELSVGGRYLDQLERREGIWRISFRTELLDWARRVPIEERWFEEDTMMPKGLRDRSDLSYRFLK